MRWIFLTLLMFVSVPLHATDDAPDKSNWQDIPWTTDYRAGLAQAATSSRPTLIYFQAPWCSWCHVYERGTLSDPEVVRLIRQNFVALLVNSDARPDLLAKFNGFGLPFTVILSAKGLLLARLPGILTPEDMQHTLQQTIDAQTTKQPEQHTQTTETLARITRLDRQAYETFLGRWLDHLDDLYDPATGLFSGVLESGAGLKRSAPLTWVWLLEFDLWPERTRRAAYATLQNLYDSQYGGFFYFRDPHRSDEHLETAKLLDANARLIHWFALAGTRYNDRALEKASSYSGNYLLRVLWGAEQGGFFQAQIADADYYSGKSNKPPALDRILRTDSNAQAAVALIAAGKLRNDPILIKKASDTIKYLLKNHLQDNLLYHSRNDEGFGPATNLPEDIFWLLVAINEVQNADPEWSSPKQTEAIYQLASQWLSKAMQNKVDTKYPNKLLGIIAWAAINISHPLIPEKTVIWSLSNVRIETTTRPDELVYAIKAWHQYSYTSH